MRQPRRAVEHLLRVSLGAAGPSPLGRQGRRSMPARPWRRRLRPAPPSGRRRRRQTRPCTAISRQGTRTDAPCAMKSRLPDHPVAITQRPSHMPSASSRPKPSARCRDNTTSALGDEAGHVFSGQGLGDQHDVGAGGELGLQGGERLGLTIGAGHLAGPASRPLAPAGRRGGTPPGSLRGSCARPPTSGPSAISTTQASKDRPQRARVRRQAWGHEHGIGDDVDRQAWGRRPAHRVGHEAGRTPHLVHIGEGAAASPAAGLPAPTPNGRCAAGP